MCAEAASTPALAAAQNPRRRGSRTTRTLAWRVATSAIAPEGEASSTTRTSVPGGMCRITEFRQAASKSDRLWLGTTMDRLGGTTPALAPHDLDEAPAGRVSAPVCEV